MSDYWKDKYNGLVDHLRDEYGASFALAMISASEGVEQ